LVAERGQEDSGPDLGERLLPAARAAGMQGRRRNFRRLVAAAKQLGGGIITAPPSGGVVAG